MEDMTDDWFESMVRMRRLRRTGSLRRMVRENVLHTDDLIQPLFVIAGRGVKKEVPSMPGVHQVSVDKVGREAKAIEALGIPAVLLFGIPQDGDKDAVGSVSWDPKGVIQRAVASIKRNTEDLCVITDLCFCEYTDHGHCGPLDEDGIVDNDETLLNLGIQAASHAAAGADMIAPSGMMDGMVDAVRESLDLHGYEDVPIMSYAAKFASAFYGPFRDAADSAPAFGDRHTYQMDPANSEEALREVELDVDEGADIVMVKPAGPCLDVVRQVKDEFGLPTAAYQVSGEYSMIKAAAENGWLNHDAVMMESLLAIKRAGADMIITYFARDAAKIIAKGKG